MPPSSSSSHKLRTAKGRRRRRPNKSSESQQSAVAEQGSILWTILLLGLVFCLADVAYMLHFVETQGTQTDSMGTLNGAGGGGTSAEVVANNNGDAHPRQDKKKHTYDEGSGAIDGVIDGILPLAEYKQMNRALFRHAQQVNGDKEREAAEAAAAEANAVPPTPLSEQEEQDIQRDKKEILDILKHAKIPPEELDPDTLRALPTWKQVTDLYGTEPRIVGLDQCADFREHSPLYEHFVSTAGTFNSGTNLMAELLIANCHMQDRMDHYGSDNRGVRWQVPWGKHNPPGDEEFRNSHKTKKDANVDARNILPAVTIRDPYVWMRSMCRIEYTAHWHHDSDRHCPNLVPDSQDLMDFGKFLKEGQSPQVHVKYADFWKHHTSLAHLWNDWYREYFELPNFPRLMVRYEDLLFFAKNVTQSVCICAGGKLKRDGSFQYVVNSAKKGASAHGPMQLRTGFVKALIKYGTAAHRTDGYQKTDLAYAKRHLDPEFMNLFHYKHPNEVPK